MLLPLLLLSSSFLTPSSPSLPLAAKDPPVRVWFNSGGNYDYGERAKVYAKAAESGYLVVLRADNEGKVRVLFPLDPGDQQRIAGGKKYELKGRGGREAFVADDSRAQGTVLAAVSQSPFRFDEFVRDGRWDSQALSDKEVRDDPEAGLLNLVNRMKQSGERFDYDVATYVVTNQYARGHYPYPYWGYDPWWGYGPRFGFGFTYRPWYYGRPWRHW